jgi:3',5'-cyclic-nucleotide phosphodiesterase
MLRILSGPERGRSFELREGANFVGRALDSDVRIDDRTVSRKHLRIAKRGGRHLVTDLGSQNGTFYDGLYLEPGSEKEVTEGLPIAIGMSVICLGVGSKEQTMPLNDTVRVSREDIEKSRAYAERRRQTTYEESDFLFRVSSVLMRGLPISESLEKILDYVFDLLKRIDRGAFILTDPQTKEIKQTISRCDVPEHDTGLAYSQRVVELVLKDKKPLVISDVQTEDNELLDTLKVLKIECVMCVPMIFGSEVFGAIYVDSLERPYGFREEDLSLFMELGQQIALTLEKARFASEIANIADTLTSDSVGSRKD